MAEHPTNTDHELVGRVFIPFSDLGSARDWRNGAAYKVKLVMIHMSSDEFGAHFEIKDATSLEKDSRHRAILNSESGHMRV